LFLQVNADFSPPSFKEKVAFVQSVKPLSSKHYYFLVALAINLLYSTEPFLPDLEKHSLLLVALLDTGFNPKQIFMDNAMVLPLISEEVVT
jgi:hypothetical protein